MHCVNKTKNYFNFQVNNFEMIKKWNKFQILFISEHCNECYNYKQYWSLISVTSHLQTKNDQMWLKYSQIK
jgi:hypothetical protein